MENQTRRDNDEHRTQYNLYIDTTKTCMQVILLHVKKLTVHLGNVLAYLVADSKE